MMGMRCLKIYIPSFPSTFPWFLMMPKVNQLKTSITPHHSLECVDDKSSHFFLECLFGKVWDGYWKGPWLWCVVYVFVCWRLGKSECVINFSATGCLSDNVDYTVKKLSIWAETSEKAVCTLILGCHFPSLQGTSRDNNRATSHEGESAMAGWHHGKHTSRVWPLWMWCLAGSAGEEGMWVYNIDIMYVLHLIYDYINIFLYLHTLDR